jgi:hypothetical protein
MRNAVTGRGTLRHERRTVRPSRFDGKLHYDAINRTPLRILDLHNELCNTGQARC